MRTYRKTKTFEMAPWVGTAKGLLLVLTHFVFQIETSVPCTISIPPSGSQLTVTQLRRTLKLKNFLSSWLSGNNNSPSYENLLLE